MSEAFEILSAALDEAIADAEEPFLPRNFLSIDDESKLSTRKFFSPRSLRIDTQQKFTRRPFRKALNLK